jgi:hypothetical protein
VPVVDVYAHFLCNFRFGGSALQNRREGLSGTTIVAHLASKAANEELSELTT